VSYQLIVPEAGELVLISEIGHDSPTLTFKLGADPQGHYAVRIGTSRSVWFTRDDMRALRDALNTLPDLERRAPMMTRPEPVRWEPAAYPPRPEPLDTAGAKALALELDCAVRAGDGVTLRWRTDAPYPMDIMVRNQDSVRSAVLDWTDIRAMADYLDRVLEHAPALKEDHHAETF
jgi:hypothetical protein